MADDMATVGFAVPQDIIDDLDDIKVRWDRREAGSVSRSAVAREALVLGVACLDLLDEHNARNVSTQQQKSLVRQALLEYFEPERR